MNRWRIFLDRLAAARDWQRSGDRDGIGPFVARRFVRLAFYHLIFGE